MRELARAAFASLLLFELLNLFRILHFDADFTWFGLVVTLLFVWLGIELPALLLRRRRVTLHPTAWPLAFLAVAFDAFGDILHLYSRVLCYDQLAHFFGAAVTMLVFWHLITAFMRALGSRCPPEITILLAYGFSAVLGAMYEIEEYLEDVFTGSRRLGDGPDTANDLMMNLFGTTVVLGVLLFDRYRQKRRKRV